MRAAWLGLMLVACGGQGPAAQPVTGPAQEAPPAQHEPVPDQETPPARPQIGWRAPWPIPTTPDEVFGSLLLRNTTELASSCDPARQVDLAVTGQIALGWTVTRGTARDVVTLTNTTGDTGLATCISKRVREWDFKTAGDGTARVTWDLHAAQMTQLSPGMKPEQVVGPPNAELIVKSNRGSLLFCHESSLESHPGIAGSLTARWNIQDGHVGDVQVDSHLDHGLVACAVSKVLRWTFTGLPDGPIQATFEFKPKAPEAEIKVADVVFEPK